MSDISINIDQAIKLYLAPLLKTHGFSKSGRDFHRKVGENWQMINVQASQGNIGDTGKFTVNLGVYLTAVSSLAGTPSSVNKPKEYDCTIRQRIGMIMPVKADCWWEISPKVNLETIVNRH